MPICYKKKTHSQIFLFSIEVYTGLWEAKKHRVLLTNVHVGFVVYPEIVSLALNPGLSHLYWSYVFILDLKLLTGFKHFSLTIFCSYATIPTLYYVRCPWTHNMLQYWAPQWRHHNAVAAPSSYGHVHRLFNFQTYVGIILVHIHNFYSVESLSQHFVTNHTFHSFSGFILSTSLQFNYWSSRFLFSQLHSFPFSGWFIGSKVFFPSHRDKMRMEFEKQIIATHKFSILDWIQPLTVQYCIS